MLARQLAFKNNNAMNIQDVPVSTNRAEQGQILVIAAGMLCALTIAMLFYLNVQRAYNLSNFLDETAELAVQAAAEPKVDDLLKGAVSIDATQAITASKAAVRFSAESNLGDLGSVIDDLTCQMEPVATRSSGCPNGTLTVLNPGDTGCEEYNTSGETDCVFPIIIVKLTLPYTLFGVDFNIGAKGVAVIGEGSADNTVNTIPIAIPTPKIEFPPIIINP